MEPIKPTRRVLDEFLVAAARTGDRKAFALLVRTWQPRLIAHAWRLSGDPEAARDSVQEAWAEIVRGLAQLADAGAFPAWAYRIVTRRCARAIARAQGRRRLAQAVAAEPFEDCRQDPDGEIDRARVAAALTGLPAEQRAAMALFYLEEMSVAEVAVALDVPAGTVKTRLMHARRKLRSALEGDE